MFIVVRSSRISYQLIDFDCIAVTLHSDLVTITARIKAKHSSGRRNSHIVLYLARPSQYQLLLLLTADHSIDRPTPRKRDRGTKRSVKSLPALLAHGVISASLGE